MDCQDSFTHEVEVELGVQEKVDRICVWKLVAVVEYSTGFT